MDAPKKWRWSSSLHFYSRRFVAKGVFLGKKSFHVFLQFGNLCGSVTWLSVRQTFLDREDLSIQINTACETHCILDLNKARILVSIRRMLDTKTIFSPPLPFPRTFWPFTTANGLVLKLLKGLQVIIVHCRIWKIYGCLYFSINFWPSPEPQ